MVTTNEERHDLQEQRCRIYCYVVVTSIFGTFFSILVLIFALTGDDLHFRIILAGGTALLVLICIAILKRSVHELGRIQAQLDDERYQIPNHNISVQVAHSSGGHFPRALPASTHRPLPNRSINSPPLTPTNTEPLLDDTRDANNQPPPSYQTVVSQEPSGSNADESHQLPSYAACANAGLVPKKYMYEWA